MLVGARLAREKSVFGRHSVTPRVRDLPLSGLDDRSSGLLYVSVASPCLTRPSNIRSERPRASNSRSLTPDCLSTNNSSTRRPFWLRPRFSRWRRHLEAKTQSRPGP
jgi:hypothetical protein